MRIANAMQTASADLAQRKQAIMRKEMDQAYKKNSKYADPTKNPLLEALENLLSGKTEKEIREQDQLASSSEQSNLESTNYDKAVFGEVEETPTSILDKNTQFILQQVHQAALSPIQPTAQDLRVAKSVEAQLQPASVVSEVPVEVEPFTDEDLSVDIPMNLLKEVKRDASAETVFGRDLERELVSRTFMKAKAIYTSHMDMVKNSYRSYNDPTFSQAI